MKNLIAFILVAFCLVCCRTPYQRRGIRGGYSDVHIGDNTYQVTVEGNGYTPMSTLISQFHKRARELCGGEYNVVSQNTDTRQNLQTINNQIHTVNRHTVTGMISCI